MGSSSEAIHLKDTVSFRMRMGPEGCQYIGSERGKAWQGCFGITRASKRGLGEAGFCLGNVGFLLI
jgi:hypothetical protein